MTALVLPHHVAIIMDGNGRWAKERHLSRSQGHLEGVKRVEEIVSEACRVGVKVLTLYAFSTENWTRPEEEISLLMRTFIAVLDHKVKELNANGIQIQFIGRRQGVPEAVLKAIDQAMTLTRHNTVMILNIAFNYGARAEIVDAVKTIDQKIRGGELNIDDIDEENFGLYLYTKNQPDVDLLIRTSGEQRISNFLLWQISYAELYFTSQYWPAFTAAEFHKALKDFANRERRYGGVKVESAEGER
ncbi:MAG: isoprenyl transferase [Candidatus Omnitrophica bacterium]|nr:isoprenyl transferase [Candidatus Omnitrophota bacterium]